MLRGHNYYLGKEASKDLILTNWNIAHTGMYLLAGFLAPDMWVVWIIIGLWWEILESFDITSCHDYTDIVCNWGGLFLGITFRNLVEKKYTVKSK